MGDAISGRTSAPIESILREVAPETWSLQMPSPSEAYVSSSCVYLVKDSLGDGHLIDSGWSGPEGTRALVAALAAIEIPLDRLRTITATHVHRDHLGQAAELRDLSGARIVLSAADRYEMVAPLADIEPLIEQWGVPADGADELRSSTSYRSPHPQVSIDLEVSDGDVLPIPGREIRVIATPGHTPGSICLDDSPRNVLFTGDTVLPKIHPGIGIEGNPAALADYLRAMGALSAAYPSRLVCPGHGTSFYGLSTRVAQHLFHLARRNREVAEQLLLSPSASVWMLASKVKWSAGWAGMGELRFSALQQTAMHLAFLMANGTPMESEDPVGLPPLRFVE